MTGPGNVPFIPNHKVSQIHKWLDFVWVLLLVILLVFTFNIYQTGNLCPFLGTDFRGYYAAAQIASQHGFAEIYNQQVQEQYQESLSFRCPDNSHAPPLIRVSMPYLPVFVVVFLPFTFVDFTNAYILWVTLNLVALLAYLYRFTYALGERVKFIRVMQWVLCVAVFSNLVLGQMNVFLVICLGEFVLFNINSQRYRGGFWLGGLLVKPHTLILLLPGLIIHKDWRSLAGFSSSALAIVLASTVLAGWSGVLSAVNLARQFFGPLIATGPTMMNFRALALNLETIMPAWFAWAVAISGIGLVTGFTLYLWRQPIGMTGMGFMGIITATLAATFAVTWHSHFYLLALLLPFLVIFDSKQVISPVYRWAWMVIPPGYFALLYLVTPEQARNLFGLGMLTLNMFILLWATWRLNQNSNKMPVDGIPSGSIGGK